jgi:hypothetical protein
MATTEREKFYECEVKRRRVRASGGYEPFWKVKAIAEALEFHLEGLALDGQPIPASVTRLAEVPEGGFAEWLTVELPMKEAISA